VSSHPKNDNQLELGEDESIIVLRRAWDRTLRSLATKVSKSSLESFFDPTKPLGFEDGVVVLGVKNRFTKEWLDKRYRDTICGILADQLDLPDVDVRFVLTSSDSKSAAQESPSMGRAQDERGRESTGSLKEEAPQASPIVSADRSRRKALPAGLTMPLNEKYTFDTFVTGKSNRLAYGVACAVADAPGLMYNPLFLYGQPGLGKTHLMHAIGHEIRRKQPNARIAYVSGESFTNSYVTALRERRFDEFRAIYRNVDVWLVDDIQTIAGKEHTKEEFFHTFNTLYQMNRQIVLSSDRSPRELRMMDERLRSRFECGLIADVAPPELETRVAILQKKAEVENIPIPQDVLIYMANLIQSNIRALEGALLRLMAYSSIYDSPLTTDLAADVLGSYFVDRKPAYQPMPSGDDIARLNQPVDMQSPRSIFEAIVEAVAEEFGISAHMIAGEGSAVTSRKRCAATPRQIAIYLAREQTSLPVIELADLFGGISHSAISHAHRKMIEQVKTNPQILAHIASINQRRTAPFTRGS
jgi:chromosomal replication initiator protein